MSIFSFEYKFHFNFLIINTHYDSSWLGKIIQRRRLAKMNGNIFIIWVEKYVQTSFPWATFWAGSSRFFYAGGVYNYQEPGSGTGPGCQGRVTPVHIGLPGGGIRHRECSSSINNLSLSESGEMICWNRGALFLFRSFLNHPNWAVYWWMSLIL